MNERLADGWRFPWEFTAFHAPACFLDCCFFLAGAIIFRRYSMTKKDSVVNALLLSASIAIVVGCVLIKLFGGF
jgi:hypothetical protein